MAKHLFTVADVLEIPGKGLLLGPGVLAVEGIKSGDVLELHAPDGTVTRTSLKAVAFLSPSPGDAPAVPILVAVPKQAVPSGTKVLRPD